MDPSTEHARTLYRAHGLVDTLHENLPGDVPLSVAEVAGLDQFHTGGLLATRELAALAEITPRTRVLDLGCGLGGPARFLAETFGCQVTGVDLSADFIDAAQYLTRRCALEEQVHFVVGNALELGFGDASFDLVFLQHVVMNVQDRAALYAGIHRILAPGGRLATYDVIRTQGTVHYPTPWARDATASVLLSERETRDALQAAGFRARVWRDDTVLATVWFKTLGRATPSAGIALAQLLGEDFPLRVANLRRNLEEGSVGILSAVLDVRDDA